MGRTLAEKIWDGHVVRPGDEEPDLLYVDLHLVHEVSSPQAFDGLRASGLRVRRPDLTLATEDHAVPTANLDRLQEDVLAAEQVGALRRNCQEFGLKLLSLGDDRQGIVHVVGPELGLSQPGMLIVCSDSHTATHGAFGALAFGIGTSEAEHVLATQTIPQTKPRFMAVEITGKLSPGVSAKDVILALIAQESANGGQGYIVEYRGEAVRAMTMEQRMTVCNMSIEWGAKAGLIGADQTTFEFLSGREAVPPPDQWSQAIDQWRTWRTDDDAVFDRIIELDATAVRPFVTRGTNPGQGVALDGVVPEPDTIADSQQRAGAIRALEYMALEPGMPLKSIAIDTVFLGSCTNGRVSDLRAAADVLRGLELAASTRMLVVPGSMQVRIQAESEGLDEVFRAAGAEWRRAGCSMCLGLNSDSLSAGQRCASTSNRNFEGRQGRGARTHLVSPEVAAATAVLGHLGEPADLTPRLDTSGVSG